VFLSIALTVGGCIFGVSTEGNGAEDTAASEPGDTTPDTTPSKGPSDAGDTARMDATDGEATELDGASRDGDGGVDADAGGPPCRPGLGPHRHDAGYHRDTTHVDTSGDATALLESPEVVYVTGNGKQNTIGVLFTGGNKLFRRQIRVSNTNSIQALGPSVHYDDDPYREIPYIEREASENGPRFMLKVVDIGESSETRRFLTGVDYPGSSRIGVADFDDDCRPDLVWADKIRSDDPDARSVVRRIDADEGRNATVVAEPDGQPWAVLGAVDLSGRKGREQDGNEELYWYEKSGTARYVVDDDNDAIQEAPESFSSVASRDGTPGVGGPSEIPARDNKTIFPIVNGRNQPGWLAAGTPDSDVLGDGVSAAASPLGTGNVDLDGQREVVFIDDGGKLGYLDAVISNGDESSELRAVEVDGNDVDAHRPTGVVSGTSRFFRRVDQR